MTEAEKQAILAEQAQRVAEAQQRVAQADAQPPPPPETPGYREQLLALLRRAKAKVVGAVPKTAQDLAAPLPKSVMPHDALKQKADERAAIEAMLRDSTK